MHPGTFEVEFPRFGFTLSTQEALGWSVGADSMRARLNPTVEHGVVEVHGTFRGDTIVGTWRYASDGGGARGRSGFGSRRVADALSFRACSAGTAMRGEESPRPGR